MSVLDLQGLEVSADGSGEGPGRNPQPSNLSVALCPGDSQLSILLCD